MVWITQVKESGAEILIPLDQWSTEKRWTESRWDMVEREGRSEHSLSFFADWLEIRASADKEVV